MTAFSTEIDGALAKFMADHDITREQAVSRILSDWLGAKGYMGSGDAEPATDVQETVQYPEFMEDASGGAGG